MQLNEPDDMIVVKVEDAYDLIERATKKGEVRIANAIRKLIEHNDEIVHLRDSASEQTHRVNLSIPFTMEQLMSGAHEGRLEQALKSQIEYAGKNHRGFICEAVALRYGHDSPADITLGLDVLNQTTVSCATIGSASAIEMNTALLDQCRKNRAHHLRVSNAASAMQMAPPPSSLASSSSSSSSSSFQIEEEMRRQISQEVQTTGYFQLDQPEVLLYNSPHIRKIYSAFAGMDRSSLLKGVIAISANNDYKYVVETSSLAPALKHRPNTRFVIDGDRFDPNAVHVFRVHKTVVLQLVDQVLANAALIEKCARRLEDIQCSIRSFTPWTRRADGTYYSERHKLSTLATTRHNFNVELEITAIYYNQPDCFASNPGNIGVWFAPVYNQKDVTNNGTVTEKSAALYDPLLKSTENIMSRLESKDEEESPTENQEDDDDSSFPPSQRGDTFASSLAAASSSEATGVSDD